MSDAEHTVGRVDELEKLTCRGSVGLVAAVSASASRGVTKPERESIQLLVGLGVDGDVHMGQTVRHRSRMARDPTQRNLRQVHLIHAVLHDELRAAGFHVAAGQMGENVTTRGIDLLALPAGARLALGAQAVVEVTGLRNPCAQLDGIQPGLMAATLDRDGRGSLVRKAGVMATVATAGEVCPGDAIGVECPRRPTGCSSQFDLHCSSSTAPSGARTGQGRWPKRAGPLRPRAGVPRRQGRREPRSRRAE